MADEEAIGGLKQWNGYNAIGSDGVPFKSIFGPSLPDRMPGLPNPQDTLKDTTQQTPKILDSVTASITTKDNQSLYSDQIGENFQQLNNTGSSPPPDNLTLKSNPAGEIKLPSQHQKAFDNQQQENPESHSSEPNVPRKGSFDEDHVDPQQRKEVNHVEEGEGPRNKKAKQVPESAQPNRRRKERVPYPHSKDAREQAVNRHWQKHKALKQHLRKEMQKQGYNIEAAEVSAPRPRRQQKTKAQVSDDSDDSDSSIDPDAPEPEAQMVSAKDNIKDIDGLTVGGGGLTNRRTGSQKTDLKDAKVTFGWGKVQTWEQEGGKLYQLQGMTVKLKPFQLAGTSWMVKRETDDGDHKGGLLADVPGFGKTVMSLGAIVGNPPSPEQIEKGIRATLIVVPNVSILKQWEAEIEKHLEYANAKYIHYKSAMKEFEPDLFNNTNIV